jgi:hypothetical protein
MRAACLGDYASWLECVSRSPASSSVKSPPASGLDDAIVSGCEGQHRAAERCLAPCREAGALHTRTARERLGSREVDVSAELVGEGCMADAPRPAKGSPAGSPCEYVSVCGAVRCPCQGSDLGYLARACVDGQCAAAELACAVAPRTVGLDACTGR